MTNGRLSRAERRLLQKEDARYLNVPFPSGPDPRPVGAHLRHMVHLLVDRTRSSPCSDMVAHVTALHDRTAPDHPGIACKKGCAHCCSQDVAITAPEAFFVAAAVRSKQTLAEALLATDDRLRGVGAVERLGQVLCPLLKDAACSIYAARPLACRGFVSVSLPACLATFVDHQAPNVPMPQANVNVLYTMRMLLKATLRLTGLEDQTYEMTAAVAVALREPDAEKRWLNGEKIFAHIPGDPPIPPQFDVAINQMAAYVAPTL